MKLFVVLCLVVIVSAAPVEKQIQYPKDNVQLLKFENDNFYNGGFRFFFDQTDGTQQEQEAQILNEGTDEETIAVKGYYSWVGPDKVVYKVSYTADDNGFQPTIEQGPGGGVPPAVVASLLG